MKPNTLIAAPKRNWNFQLWIDLVLCLFWKGCKVGYKSHLVIGLVLNCFGGMIIQCKLLQYAIIRDPNFKTIKLKQICSRKFMNTEWMAQPDISQKTLWHHNCLTYLCGCFVSIKKAVKLLTGIPAEVKCVDTFYFRLQTLISLLLNFILPV